MVIAMQDWVTTASAALVTIALAWLIGGTFWRLYSKGRVIVFENEAGLKYHNGRLVAVLGPGRYGTWPASVMITRLDLREFSSVVPGQEMLTADQMSVRVSVVAAYRIADPLMYAKNANNPIPRFYQHVQTALREAVAKQTLDVLLANRELAVAGMSEAIASEATTLGLAVNSVKLLDLTLAGPAKQAYADLWRAQKEGLAALERARGEHAALRTLANAARMLKNNPELMNLRVLQAVSGAQGKNAPTIVLGGAGGLLPVSSGGGVDEGGENQS